MLTIRPSQFSVFEQESRRRFASAVLAELRDSAPHTVAGLSSAELSARVDIAVSKAVAHQLDDVDDFMAFVRLSLAVGPLFDEYPPFEAILSSHDRANRIPALFSLATKDDWNKAAQFDIIRRYRKTMPCVASVSLEVLDACHFDSYFREALHPDVWRLGRTKPLTTIDQVRHWLQDAAPSTRTGHAIVSHDHQFLGAIFLFQDAAVARAAYWVARPAWGKGIASLALMQLRALLREQALMLSIDPGNTPSRRVAAKCGFRQIDTSTFVA